MRYVALLRGVNVGGKGIINMKSIREVFQKAGFTNVTTYINSGNILFWSDKSAVQLTKAIEDLLEENFFAIGIVVLSFENLRQVVTHMPHDWNQEDLRKYIGFIKSPVTPEEIIQEAQLKEGVDVIQKGEKVVYMSTKMNGLTKSGFPKLIAKPIYKYVTIRNVNTVQKLLMLMEKE